MKVIDKVSNFLEKDLQLDSIFTVGGANIEDFLISLKKKTSIEIIMAKHEHSAGNMAQGYYLATGKIGVVCTTSGGGAFNFIPSLAEAKATQIPLLGIIGGVVGTLEGKGVFQDSSGLYFSPDLEHSLKGVSVLTHRYCQNGSLISVLETLIKEAYRKKGPAVLVLPRDLQALDYEENEDAACGDYMRDENDEVEIFENNRLHTKNKMFSGTKWRHHIERDVMASDLIAEAARKLMTELEKDPKKDIDLIITNVSIPDEIFTGCGAVVQKKLGSNASWIFDLHNTGCIAFIYMAEMAKAMMEAHGLKSALLCSVQTAGGRIFLHPLNRNLISKNFQPDSWSKFLRGRSPSWVFSRNGVCHGHESHSVSVWDVAV